jgi:hypothetical protein
MKHSSTFRTFCHAVALIIEAVGTFFILLDTIRMENQLHASGYASYGGEESLPYHNWYYHSVVLGFSLLFLGMIIAAFVLWLEHLAHAKASIASKR